MEQIIEFLFSGQGLIVLFVLVSMLGSTVSGLMQKVAKKAAQQQQARPPEARPNEPKVAGQMQRMASSQGQMQQSRPAPQTRQAPPPSPAQRPAARTQPSRGPGAEDIAREIRRLMGMEPPAPAQPVAPPPAALVIPDKPAARQHHERGHLAEEMQLRDQKKVHLGQLQDRHLRLGSEVAERRLDTALTMRFDKEKADRLALRKKRARKVGHLLDLSRPAAAFLAGEVFGQPRAIKGWDS